MTLNSLDHSRIFCFRTHAVSLETKNMFDPGTHLALGRVFFQDVRPISGKAAS